MNSIFKEIEMLKVEKSTEEILQAALDDAHNIDVHDAVLTIESAKENLRREKFNASLKILADNNNFTEYARMMNEDAERSLVIDRKVVIGG